MRSYMDNPLFVGRELYCLYRGYVEIYEVGNEDFKVSYHDIVYLQKYIDIGKTIFLNKSHAEYKSELYKFVEYIYFFPQWKEKNEEYVKKLKEGIYARDPREKKIQKIIEMDANKIKRRKIQEQVIKRMEDLESNNSGKHSTEDLSLGKGTTSNVYKEEVSYLSKVNDFIDNKLEDLEKKYLICRENSKFTYSPTAEERADRYDDLDKARRIKANISHLTEFMDSPYFARMDFYIYGGHETINEKMYIGKISINNGKEEFVYDWRSPIGQRYYLKNELDFKYNEYTYNTLLRRAIEIEDRKFVAYNDEYVAGENKDNNGVGDPFLIEVLKKKRGQARITDIIKTIQFNQNNIIRESIDKDIVVQGCAGSGKTMILMHRLSYILFNYPKLDVNRIKIITPNEVFDKQLNDLARELQLDKIERITIENYYINKLSEYKVPLKIKNGLQLGQENLELSYFQYVYSEDFKKRLQMCLINWYEDIERKAKELKIFSLATYFNISSSKGSTYKDKVDNLRYILTQILYFNNKNSEKKLGILGLIEVVDNEIIEIKANITNVEQLIKNLEIQYSSEIIKVQEDKERLSEEIISLRNQLSSKTDTISIENKIITLNEELEECKKRLNLSFITSKKEELEAQYKQILEQINSCGLFEFVKKRNLRDKLANVENQMRELANPNTAVYLNINGQVISVNERIQQINEELSLYSNKLEDIKNKVVLGEHALSAKEKRQTEIEAEITRFTDTLIKFEKSYNDEQEKLLAKNNYRFDLTNKLVELEKSILREKIVTELKDFQTLLPGDMNFISDKLYPSFRKDIISEFKISSDNKVYRSDLVNLLYLSYSYTGCLLNNDRLLNIDEGQDVPLKEYELMKDINGGKAKFNIYGDNNQLIKANGISSWKEFKAITELSYFELNENYRNTIEITKYCNRTFSFSFTPIGISGVNVQSHELPNVDTKIILNKFQEDNSVRKAIIVKDASVNVLKLLEKAISPSKFNFVSSAAKDILSDKINVFTVQMCKGLEFDSVLVFTEAMTKNEKYISTTRALDKLIVVA